MSVLSQTFFSLMSGHFMSLSFLTTGHSSKDFVCLLKLFGFLHSVHKGLAGLEGRDIVSGDGDGFVLGNIAGRLGSSFFDDETSKTSQINVLTSHHGILDRRHKHFNDGLHTVLVKTGLVGNLIHDISFSHSF
jgi:hypothetical protein